jgi:hypothetical protein
MAPAAARATDARDGIDRLRGYLRRNFAAANTHNRLWGLLASAAIDGPLTPADRDGTVAELRRVQNGDGGWSLEKLGGWQWNRTAPPFQSPGVRDRAVSSPSDGYATGLIVYALRRAGLPEDHPVIARGVRWLKANQRAFQVADRRWTAWRAHSLNYDREHGGPRGEPWRRLFMSDAATAFAVLALAGVE